MALTVFIRERTDPGLVRKQNQDFHGYHQPPRGSPLHEAKGELYIVADGMGGGAAGDLAGQWSVQKVIYEYYNDPDPTHDPAASLRRAIEEANYGLYVNATTDPSRKDMGSTIVAAVIWGHLLIVANVGDSRAYLVRNGQIFRLTEDHSWVAEALKKGLLSPEEAANHPNRNVLTRNLGGRPDVEVDIHNYTLQPGDTVILCTDGLHGVVSDTEIAQTASQPDLSQASSQLIALANERGGPDNITATLLHLCDEEEARRLRRLSDTQPIEVAPPPPLDHFLQARPAPSSGLLEEFAEFFRLYPTLSAVAVAFILGLVTLALVLLLISRGGEGHGEVSTSALAAPTTPPATIPQLPSPASSPASAPPPTPPPYGYLAYIDAQSKLHVDRVEKKGDGLCLIEVDVITSTPTAHPTWVPPDGKWLIFQRSEKQDKDGEFYVISWDGQESGKPRPLQDGNGNTLKGRYPAVSPRGEYLAYTAGNAIWCCTLRLSPEKATCNEAKQVSQVSKPPQQGEDRYEDRYPAWSRDREIAFARLNVTVTTVTGEILNCNPQWDIWKTDLEGKEQPLITEKVLDAYPAWSPDRNWLAWTTCREYKALNLGVVDVPKLLGDPTTEPKVWRATGI